METSTGAPRLPTPAIGLNPIEVDNKIKRKLLKQGVYPTPKIIHTHRKKNIQKTLRKSKKLCLSSREPSLSDSQKQELAEEAHFQTIKAEYKTFNKAINAKMTGKPWERLERGKLRELSSLSNEYGGEKLKSEHLRELSHILEIERDKFRWLLDDDIELEQGLVDDQRPNWTPTKRRGGDSEAIQFLVDRLSDTELTMKDWKFRRMMKQSQLQFTEVQLMKILEGLGDKGQWKHALSVVEWVYNSKEHKQYKSRFVYTKLLAVLGKVRKPHEALRIFNLMLGDCHIYPDMAAYHSISVTLGQAGFLKELLNIIECMKQKPSRKIKNLHRKSWDPVLQPDVVVFNAVLNACVPSRQWRGVSWVFDQLRKGGLKPNGATYGLAMEVMLQSGKYELVYEYFGKMKRSGEAIKALTYKVLVKAFWEDGKVNEAVRVVRDMEQRGLVGAACVYYELACCLCNNGRWLEAMVEIEKLKKLPRAKPLEVTFTGMILSALDGGHVGHCINIFKRSKNHCAHGIGIINAMLKIYGQNDMFSEARELFENIKRDDFDSNTGPNDYSSSLISDAYTYSSMLEASAAALQWEYFENVYKEMVLSGYQLDQSKHASLLVKASINGKCCLLEHAFDTTLEAGEIPHPSFFTEMVFQATTQQDYRRAVAIVNTMAYAPFQVSEKQWMDLFEENRDRISKDSLKKLLDSLCSQDLVKEVSVSNLLRLLQSLCVSTSTENSSNLIVCGEEIIGESGKGFEADGNFSANAKKLNSGEDFQVNNDAVSSNQPSNSGEDDTVSEFAHGNENYGCRGDGMAICNNMEGFVTDFSFNESVALSLDRNSKIDEVGESDVLNMLEHEMSDSDRTFVPSAQEILESWKESRKKDGIFFSFQFDQM